MTGIVGMMFSNDDIRHDALKRIIYNVNGVLTASPRRFRLLFWKFGLIFDIPMIPPFQGRISWAIYGLPKVSLGPLYQCSTPCFKGGLFYNQYQNTP
jgi:hypothetical protein